MLDNFRFETFVDVHSNIFAEYLSSVIAKLPKENPEYRSTEERIEELYKEYPKVMEALDTEKPSDLSEQECKALIEVLELRNRLSDMQQEAIYFRGCYDLSLIHILYHLFGFEDKLKAMNEAKRVTKPGGKILVEMCIRDRAYSETEY